MKRLVLSIVCVLFCVAAWGGVRTVVFIEKDTDPGEDIFIRGGHDAGLVPAHYPSLSEPIRYNNLKNEDSLALKQGDSSLDWGSPSALDWTTSAWPSSWGSKKTYADNGFGEDPENQWGHHWWKFDVRMDGNPGDWFEFKAVLRKNGTDYWESPISQSGTPFTTGNHWGRKGYITRVSWGQDWVEFIPLNQVVVTPEMPTPGTTVTIRYFGKYRDRNNLYIHYGFNGWNYVNDALNLRRQDDSGNVNWYKEKALVAHPDGGFSTTVYIPNDARVLHCVFYTLEGSSRLWDNNGGRDFAVAARYPLIGPFLTWNDQARSHNGIVINFETARPCLGRVDYGLTTALGSSVTERSADTMHHLALTGLAPGTTYYYRISDDRGNQGAVHSFRTARQDDNNFRFAVLADMQDNGDDRRWSDVAAEVLANHNNVAFLVVVGDMPWDDEAGHWWTFFDKGRTLFAGKAIMPALGNHDTPTVGSNPDSSSFLRYFALPTASGSAEYYDFAWGTARFLSLNSEVPAQFAVNGGVQYAWAADRIAHFASGADGTTDWMFAYWHIPPYDAAARHYTQQGAFRDITGLFDGAVDWVFCGHEHLYQRIKPMRYNAWLAPSGQYGNGSQDGVAYLVVPPAGNYPSNEIIHYDWSKAYYRDRVAWPTFGSYDNHVTSEVGFVTVDISGRSIDVRTWFMGTLSSPRSAYVWDRVQYSK